MRPHLTYANVVATIALFVSLGGGAFAAFKLPRNSVGPAQIKPNAVRSSDVKNGSLRAGDFAAGQLPAGQPGQPGQQGPKGDPGPKGDQGQPGTNGLDGTARWYAHIAANGAISAGKDISSVGHVNGTGTYCVHLSGASAPNDTTGVVVTPELEGGATTFGSTGDESRTIAEYRADAGDCTGGDVVQVQTGHQAFNNGTFTGNVADDEPFFIAVP